MRFKAVPPFGSAEGRLRRGIYAEGGLLVAHVEERGANPLYTAPLPLPLSELSFTTKASSTGMPSAGLSAGTSVSGMAGFHATIVPSSVEKMNAAGLLPVLPVITKALLP